MFSGSSILLDAVKNTILTSSYCPVTVCLSVSLSNSVPQVQLEGSDHLLLEVHAAAEVGGAQGVTLFPSISTVSLEQTKHREWG